MPAPSASGSRRSPTRLGLRLPVYALLTKADLLAGFTEFFDDLDAEKRGQVWGTTFAAEADQARPGPVGQASRPEFCSCWCKQLEERMLDRLAAERSPERRAMIVGFPTQVASLEAPLDRIPDRGLRRLDARPGALSARRRT